MLPRKCGPFFCKQIRMLKGCIANGSRRRGSNYYANHENQFDMDSPSPTTSAPECLNHIDEDEDFLNTQAFDPISTQAQVPSSTQALIVGDMPLSGRVSSPRRTNKTRKRKAISEFHENYLAYKREETSQYCAIMEKNAIRNNECADKFSVAAAIEAYKCSIPDYEMADFIFACDMFIAKPRFVRHSYVLLKKDGQNGSS